MVKDNYDRQLEVEAEQDQIESDLLINSEFYDQEEEAEEL